MDNNFSLNLKHISKELSCMLELLKESDEQSCQISMEYIVKDVNWNLFIELSIHHRLFPMLYSKLKKVNTSIVPPNVIKTLKRYYKQNTFQMLHLSAEMDIVNQLFSQREIRLLFLKGPFLAETLYGDISLRTSGDLDFLIPIEKLEEAEELLIELGYEKDDYIETVLNDWKWRHHHVTFFHPQKGIKLEMHWRLHPGPGKEQSFNELWERKNQRFFGESPVFMLANEDLLLFLASHGARHGWSRLRWLMDIHQILKIRLDWPEMNKLAKRYHLRHVVGQAIILSSQLFNSKVKKEIQPLLELKRSKKLAQEALFYIERMVNLHTDPVPKEVSSYHQRHLFSLMSYHQKALFLLNFLYPYPEDAQTLPLPKAFHFLYFPLRPVLWAWRKSRKHALP